jgi:plasmid maintenance system antidote protein VapI
VDTSFLVALERETASLRIEKAFGVSMDTLMRLQGAYDIARARKDAAKIRVRRYQPNAANA